MTKYLLRSSSKIGKYAPKKNENDVKYKIIVKKIQNFSRIRHLLRILYFLRYGMQNPLVSAVEIKATGPRKVTISNSKCSIFVQAAFQTSSI